MWSIFLPELVFSYSPVTAFQLQMTWLSLTFSLDLFFFLLSSSLPNPFTPFLPPFYASDLSSSLAPNHHQHQPSVSSILHPPAHSFTVPL